MKACIFNDFYQQSELLPEKLHNFDNWGAGLGWTGLTLYTHAVNSAAKQWNQTTLKSFWPEVHFELQDL